MVKIGDTVFYVPEQPDSETDPLIILPAIVVMVYGETFAVNITVFTNDNQNPVILETSVLFDNDRGLNTWHFT